MMSSGVTAPKGFRAAGVSAGIKANKGLDLAPKPILPEVFDLRAVEKGQVRFHDAAYVEVTPRYGRAALLRSLGDQQGEGKKAARRRRPACA